MQYCCPGPGQAYYKEGLFDRLLSHPGAPCPVVDKSQTDAKVIQYIPIGGDTADLGELGLLPQRCRELLQANPERFVTPVPHARSLLRVIDQPVCTQLRLGNLCTFEKVTNCVYQSHVFGARTLQIQVSCL
jgi:hypothetical protein